jgi:protocatechuate 3,4-dioxygenase beta subunit
MLQKSRDKSNKSTTTIINKRAVLVTIALYFTVLIVLGTELTPTRVAAQLILNNTNSSISSNQNMSPPSRPIPMAFPPPPISELSAAQKSASTNKTCAITPSLVESEGTPQQTEGPYFVDNMPNRSDIRSDPSDGSVQEGIPLNLVIHVYSVDDNGICSPLKGARIDIWHANSEGVYSAVSDQGTTEKKFLRGYQLTDNDGTVRFITIYPGWYQGRAIHIHDKIRTFNGSEKTLEWTSQLYFSNSVNDEVHKQQPYNKHGPPDITNEQDGIYTGASTDQLIQSNTGKHLMLNLTKEGQQQQQQSYLGTFNIVLNVTQQSSKR